MGHQKIKTRWISMEDLIPPINWTLPFVATFDGKQYQITGADFVDRLWRAEEMAYATSTKI